jgi:adenylate kinase family enzyme
MQTTSTTNPPGLALPFVGRGKELARLKQLHAQRKHVLILGPSGVGKSALLARLRQQLPLLLCPHSEHFGEICDSLEGELGLRAADLKLIQRKQRLRQALAEAGRTVVFDGLGWTTPKLSSFLETVKARGPVWIATRSERSWDIGHFWLQLARFERVELHPFHLPETQALVEVMVKRRMIPPDTRRIVEWLQRRSAGSPLVLRELFAELANGHYDLSNPLALRRLDLDRRIHEVFPVQGEL